MIKTIALILLCGVMFAGLITVPTKNTGDALTAAEFSQIVEALRYSGYDIAPAGVSANGRVSANSLYVGAGNAGIGITAPQTKLEVAGTVSANRFESKLLTWNVYSPVISSTMNVNAATGAPRETKWMRVGNIVSVSGVASAYPVAIGPCSFELPLPIASDLDLGWDVSGVGTYLYSANTSQNVVRIAASSNANTAVFYWAADAALDSSIMFNYMYIIK